MECKTEMKDVQHMGGRRGIWDAEVGYRTQEMGCGCRTWNAQVGFRVQIWDGGAGHGMLQHQSTTAQPQLCTGILEHPWRWGVRATSREMQISKAKLSLSNPIQTFCSLSPIWEADPSHLATSACQMCQGGEQSPCGWETSPVSCVQVGNAALPYHTCSGEIPGWDQGAVGRKDWMGPTQPHRLFSLQLIFCPVAGGGGNETQPGCSYRERSPVWPSKDPGLISGGRS